MCGHGRAAKSLAGRRGAASFSRAGSCSRKEVGDASSSTPGLVDSPLYMKPGCSSPSPMRKLKGKGPLFLRAHQESEGPIIVRLLQDGKPLRRAHIGGVHQEPDRGPVFYGPHIHFPTTVFRVIEGRRSRTRIYNWDVPEGISLWDAIMAFAAEINLVGEPAE